MTRVVAFGVFVSRDCVMFCSRRERAPGVSSAMSINEELGNGINVLERTALRDFRRVANYHVCPIVNERSFDRATLMLCSGIVTTDNLAPYRGGTANTSIERAGNFYFWVCQHVVYTCVYLRSVLPTVDSTVVRKTPLA